MNNSVPVEYLSSFTQANQSLMLHLATELLGEGGRIGDFQRFAELAQVQQDYVQQMGALWLNIMMQSATESIQPGKGDRRRRIRLLPSCHPARSTRFSKRRTRISSPRSSPTTSCLAS